MSACPKCGETFGYYEKSICTHNQSFSFDGEPYDCIIHGVRGGKHKFCCDCNANITAYVENLKAEQANTAPSPEGSAAE